MSEIFISYERGATTLVAQRIVESLRRVGYLVWWDEDLPAHRSFSEVLDERLRAATVVLVVWSEAAARSLWVRAEADFALSHDKLVQASADSALPPIPFNQIQCARLQDWAGDPEHPEWQRILASLRDLTGGPNGSHATTSPAYSAPGVPSPSARLRVRVRVLAAALFAVGVVGVGLFVAHKPSTDELRDDAMRVAVLPFELLDGSNTTSAFAKTLTDEIVGVLNENQLQTVSAGEAQELAAADSDDARRRLGVGLVVGGSLRTDNDTLQIRVHLDDPAARITLWTNQFERPVVEGEALRTAVAVATAEVVSDAFDARRGPRVDAGTLALYMKALQAMRGGTLLNTGVARAAFDQILAREPNFAAARACLSLVLLDADPDRARQEAERAIAIDSHAAGAAYDALFQLAEKQHPRLLTALEDELLKGLRAAPEFPYLNMRECAFLLSVGRTNDAVRYCQRAAALAPFAAPVSGYNSYALFAADQNPEAQSTIDAAAKVHPDSFWIQTTRLELAAFGRSPDAAMSVLHRSNMPPDAAAALESFLTARRSPTPAATDAAIEQLHTAIAAGKLWPQHPAPQYLVMGAAMLGRADSAFAALDDFANGFSIVNLRSLFDPATASLRRDTRFWPIAAKFGMIDYWRARNVWPDFCADKTLPYDCHTQADRVAPIRG
jgi:TolB-like protein